MLMLMALLAFWSELLHRKYKITLMRLASLSDFLKSRQTADIAKEAAADSLRVGRFSQLERLQVMFGVTTGIDRDESLIAGQGCKGQELPLGLGLGGQWCNRRMRLPT
jgi:hypothetical protein